MQIRMAAVLFFGIWLGFGAWIPQAAATEKKIILIPPHIDYVSRQEAADHSYSLLFAALGRNVYFNMNSGIVQFNSFTQTINDPLRYEALTTVTAGQEDNLIIQQFYQMVKDSSYRLRNACRAHQADLIAWADFESDFNENLLNAIENRSNCFINIHMEIFDCETNRKLPEESFKLYYRHASGNFSEPSRKAISNTLFKTLKNKHFPQQSPSPNSENKLP